MPTPTAARTPALLTAPPLAAPPPDPWSVVSHGTPSSSATDDGWAVASHGSDSGTHGGGQPPNWIDDISDSASFLGNELKGLLDPHNIPATAKGIIDTFSPALGMNVAGLRDRIQAQNREVHSAQNAPETADKVAHYASAITGLPAGQMYDQYANGQMDDLAQGIGHNVFPFVFAKALPEIPKVPGAVGNMMDSAGTMATSPLAKLTAKTAFDLWGGFGGSTVGKFATGVKNLIWPKEPPPKVWAAPPVTGWKTQTPVAAPGVTFKDREAPVAAPKVTFTDREAPREAPRAAPGVTFPAKETPPAPRAAPPVGEFKDRVPPPPKNPMPKAAAPVFRDRTPPEESEGTGSGGSGSTPTTRTPNIQEITKDFIQRNSITPEEIQAMTDEQRKNLEKTAKAAYDRDQYVKAAGGNPSTQPPNYPPPPPPPPGTPETPITPVAGAPGSTHKTQVRVGNWIADKKVNLIEYWKANGITPDQAAGKSLDERNGMLRSIYDDAKSKGRPVPNGTKFPKTGYQPFNADNLSTWDEAVDDYRAGK